MMCTLNAPPKAGLSNGGVCIRLPELPVQVTASLQVSKRGVLTGSSLETVMQRLSQHKP